MKNFTFLTFLKRKSVGVLAMVLVFASSFAQDPYTVHFQGESIEMPENIATFEWSQMPETAQLDRGYVGWVQFYETPNQETQDLFSANRLELLDYIPYKTYLFHFPETTSINLLRNHGVRSIVPVDGRFKLSEDLRNGNIGEWAVNGDNTLVTLIYHENVSNQYVVNELASLQISVSEQFANSNHIDLSIPDNCLDALTALSFVKYVEVIVPPSILDSEKSNGLHRASGLDTQSMAGRTYDGEGVGVMIRDDGTAGPHVDFEGRITNIGGSGGTHGDQTSGCIAGSGNVRPDARGSAAGSELVVVNYVANFLDNNTVSRINDGTTQVTNSSYSNGCNAGYTSIARTVDTQTHDIGTLTHVFSAGNSNGSNCGYGAGSQWGNITGGHKTGKNVITVGATEFDGDIAGFSSRGPAADGRIKPDISGHGVSVLMTLPNNNYGSNSGTSFSAPSTAGVVAQLYQVYMEENGGALPTSGLIKAAMLNCATDFGNAGPDFIFGWGIVNGLRAGILIEDGRYLSDDISQGNTNTHTINVPAGTAQVRFMVYWTDEPATAGASPALVNDLDLVVTDPGAGMHLPYLLDHTPPAGNIGAPAGNGADHLNNVEQVVIDAPAAGDYDIDITGFDVPMGPQEYFVVYEIIEDNLTVTYPNGFEKVRPSTSVVVHWDPVDTTDPFDVEYSDDNGSTWNMIGTAPANRFNINWTTPNIAYTGDMLVRVTSGAFSDVSDDNFSLAEYPTGITVDEVCPTEITLSWNAVPDAESYDLWILGDKYMEVVGNSTTTSITVPFDGNEDFWYSVSSKNDTDGWESRRRQAVEYDDGIDCGLGLDEFALSNVTLYPNPAEDLVFVNLANDDFSSFDIRVTNSLGQVLQTLSSDTNQAAINISNYQTGLYFVTIDSDGQSTTKKLLVR